METWRSEHFLCLPHCQLDMWRLSVASRHLLFVSWCTRQGVSVLSGMVIQTRDGGAAAAKDLTGTWVPRSCSYLPHILTTELYRTSPPLLIVHLKHYGSHTNKNKNKCLRHSTNQICLILDTYVNYQLNHIHTQMTCIILHQLICM